MGDVISLHIFLILGVCILQALSADLETIQTTDEKLTIVQLAGQIGIPCEVFDVTTEDGYIIQLHHFTGNDDPSKPPTLWWHGLFGASDGLILRGPNSTLASLYFGGYDIWIGNSRGNRYGRRHVTLNPDKDKKFWCFSFHEMGFYDLAAVIDFILGKTGQAKLTYIGYSMSTAMAFILLSTRQSYNEKIRLLIMLAPIAQLNHLKGSAKALPIAWPVISPALKLLGKEEIVRDGSAERELMAFACSQGPLAYELCIKGVIMSVVGYDPSEFEPEFAANATKYFPAGASALTLDHMSQVANGKQFKNFDYGPLGNYAKYKSFCPPEYKVELVKVPTALLVGANDYLSTVEDVEFLRNSLPNIVYYKVWDYPKFNHLDHTWAKNINTLVNPTIKFLVTTY